MDLGCPQHGQPYCLPDGRDGWDPDGLKLSLSIRHCEEAAFQVAQTSWDWGEIFHLFIDLSCEGVSDAVSTAPYRIGCSNSRRELILKGMERK